MWGLVIPFVLGDIDAEGKFRLEPHGTGDVPTEEANQDVSVHVAVVCTIFSSPISVWSKLLWDASKVVRRQRVARGSQCSPGTLETRRRHP